ncbi:family 78 glycoside hydrolase catalytic domain [Ferruginibacter sp. SUN106]|uniref:family 78 glycoside hydrolase catalytic domain n=1 Tax=Ferruginibacter sp. SUN106 TaxID=2978348 RepID=UPI003D363B2F
MKRNLVFILTLLLVGKSFGQQLTIANLQCEHKVNPPGINTTAPQFSWQLQSPQRNVVQTAYRVLVSDKVELLQKNVGNIWDSKKISSNQSIQILFKGKKISAAAKYFWKVQVWDNKNNTTWSEPANFTTGLLTINDWSNAKWIGYEELPDSLLTVPGVHSPDIKRKLGPDKLKQRSIVPLFRKLFTAEKEIAAATVYVSGLGQYELSINGEKIGNSFLAPGWTNYDKKVLYNIYDVTNIVKQGDNVIGAIVGNGFYNISRERYIKLAVAYGYPKLICKMVITYTDRSSAIVVSDQSWTTTPSPITFTSIYGGEDYDANLEQKGWDNKNFNDAGWKQAIAVTPPKGLLEAEMDNAIKVNAVLNVQTVIKPKDSVYLFDFAQNLSGIIELKVQGKKGQVVKLSPGELVHSTKLINQNATGKPYYYSYTLKGDGVETWRQRFTYTGFRYVQVEGAIPDTVTASGDFAKIISLTSLHTGNSSTLNGSFECSNKLFNDINHLIQWAIKSNLQSVVTDCPHREKLSWLEQDYLMGGSINANYDVYQLYKKLVYDMMEAQTAEGLVPDIAPEFVFFDDNGFGFRDSPEWGSASVIVPWLLYKWYGDEAILKTAYPMMKKYVAYLQKKSASNILDFGLGDWYDYGPKPPGVAQLTPKALTATAIYFYDVQLLSQIATVIKNNADAVEYKKLGSEINTAFTNKFFNTATKVYSTGSQTAMAMPLCVGLVATKDKAAVMKNMVDSIIASGKKLTAGDIGFHFLIQALHEGNASQLIYDMNYRDDVAGYGYQLKKGATALTESWAALAEVSNNHLMLGHIMQWFYEGLGGIQQAENSVGYKQIVIKPEVVGDISYVNANHQTVYGNIVSQWKKTTGVFELYVEIPANTTATIYLPSKEIKNITEGDKAITNANGISIAGVENGRVKIKIGSGKFHFKVINPLF